MSDEPAHLDDYRPIWVVTREKCRNCHQGVIGVVQVTWDLDRLTCSSCHQDTSRVTHYAGPPTPSATACGLFMAVTGPQRLEVVWQRRLEALTSAQAQEGKPAQSRDPKAD